MKDLPAIYPQHRPEFQTKLEMAVELLRSAHFWLKYLGKPLWVVVDGAYAKAPFLKPAMSLGMTVVSRLRKDAALWMVASSRETTMRRLLANRLVFATGAVVIAMAILFALLRVAG